MQDPIIGVDDKLDSNDDDIEEDLDIFPDSIGSGGDIGGSEGGIKRFTNAFS